MTIFTIYERPIDYPNCRYVVRRWRRHDNGSLICDFIPTYQGDNLTEARNAIPAAVNIGRTPNDQTAILENWIDAA